MATPDPPPPSLTPCLSLVDPVEIWRLFGGPRQSQRRGPRSWTNFGIHVSIFQNLSCPLLGTVALSETQTDWGGAIPYACQGGSFSDWIFVHSMWLLHWEFSDTIILMLKDKIIFGVSPKKGKSPWTNLLPWNRPDKAELINLTNLLLSSKLTQ